MFSANKKDSSLLFAKNGSMVPQTGLQFQHRLSDGPKNNGIGLLSLVIITSATLDFHPSGASAELFAPVFHVFVLNNNYKTLIKLELLRRHNSPPPPTLPIFSTSPIQLGINRGWGWVCTIVSKFLGDMKQVFGSFIHQQWVKCILGILKWTFE